MKFEDRSHEQTEKDCSDAPEERHGTLPTTFTNSKRTTKLHSTRPRKSGYSQLRQQKSRKKEFVVDSGACMHMVSKRDLNSAELETMRISKNPTTVMTANGEVLTREEATENVKELELFVTVLLLEETPAVLSLGKLCEEHWFSCHWISGRKPHLTEKGKRTNRLQYIELCTICGSRFISEFFLNNAHTYLVIIFITGFRI